jgi:transposase
MMLIPQSVRIFVARERCDMRKSFDGLSNMVRGVLAENPLCGHMFVFVNRRANQVKILVWTRGGFTIMHKRLEQGQFHFPKHLADDCSHVEIGAHELAMLLEGLVPSQLPGSARWSPATQRRAS